MYPYKKSQLQPKLQLKNSVATPLGTANISVVALLATGKISVATQIVT
jgi:hypothetical protein